MTEYEHNKLMDTVSELQVGQASIVANLGHLTVQVGEIKRALEAATPKQDLARLENRINVVESHFQSEMGELKRTVSVLTSTVERGRGMLILANVAWAALLGGLQIWSYLHK